MSEDNLVKILFRFYSDILEEHTVETMWAKIADAEKGYYKIANIPFYVPVLASGDTVLAQFDEDEGMLIYKETIEHSGNSTIHVIITDDELELQTVYNLFTGLGCPCEGINGNYLAIEIPADMDYLPIKERLELMEQDEVIGYAETCLARGHRYKDMELGF
ncbi:DUF4265 domain-containing protein [Mucilaginibacter sp. L3T2-6]|uniref:DUF4265 domain-containing protein n=1 Tax=Mucilaginibacter sp. L3T2-6 TaxID=3062491 RepID=UPI002676C94B|nr:DUF4265 domain-containing protein [Mucilaginibacter sp. L3T2-6]MDO3644769.1 DUF4265 domain-containing protein [Mucilaginibacter sp. L3T2-6]MDV6217195.1 DUF4265 domain-containing protein [Mucilaginibacter sp. L3T2-6]